MNERVIAVNGEFSIKNGEHAGTQITVKLPFA
jgi:signal transduction histidine kinase